MNWGFVLWDIVDHYLTAYLLNLIGILQAFGCGWFFDAAETSERSPGHKKAIYIITVGYWFTLLFVGVIFTLLEDNVLGFIVFGVSQLISVIVAFIASGLSAKEFYEEIFMCGVKRIALSCSQLGRKDVN